MKIASTLCTGLVGAIGAVAAPMAFVLMAAGAVAGVGALHPPIRARGPTDLAGVPSVYVDDAEAAARRFGVPWAVLLGIYRVECDFGRAPLPGCNPPGTMNAAGAQGPGQFLPSTWRAGLAPRSLIRPGPPTSSDALGFATDGDGDGVADVWDPADALASTARLLAADGVASDLPGAVWDYNHSWAYVRKVLSLARRYQAAAEPVGPIGAVVGFARSQLGVRYSWGGATPAGWDCSGLVMAAFAQVGVALPHNAELQYEATQGVAVPVTAVQPGDLVFFGPTVASIDHVGIVVGGGEMIDAPHTGAVVRVEPYGWPDLVAATRPLALPGA